MKDLATIRSELAALFDQIQSSELSQEKINLLDSLITQGVSLRNRLMNQLEIQIAKAEEAKQKEAESEEAAESEDLESEEVEKSAEEEADSEEEILDEET